MMRTNLRIGIFKSFYYFTSDFFPLFALAPSYFAGHTTLGSLNQARYAQGSVLGSLSWFMNSYDMLTSYRAICQRLLEFMRAAEDAAIGRVVACRASPALRCPPATSLQM